MLSACFNGRRESSTSTSQSSPFQAEPGAQRGTLISMRTALTLLCCDFRSGLLRLDRGVGQTIAALDQIFEPLGEACCRSAIDDIMIKTDRQTVSVLERAA